MAYVTGSQIYVRSGPSQSHYPTGQIPQGYAVEVYRHDGDGWCAVRPPEGSFSWLPSHQVRPTNAGIVEVVDDHVVARVGSTLSPSRSAVQVLLPKGERMELIPVNENDDPRWVRIAAPAGEFRWVAASDLSRQPPMEIAPVPQPPAESGWSKQSEHRPAPVDTEPSVFDHLTQTNKPSNSGLQFGTPPKKPASLPLPLLQSDPNAMEVVAGSPAELQLAQFQSQPTSLAPLALFNGSEAAALAAPSTQPRVRFRGLTAPTPATVGSVEELELRLSQAVVSPPQQWELDPLETAANSLLAETKNPPVRAQLREVLERITRFQEVQKRYNNPTAPIVLSRNPVKRDSFESSPARFDDSSALTGMSSSVRERVRRDLASRTRSRSSGRGVAGAGAGVATSLAAESSVEGALYAATGLLKSVVSKREHAPQYALVDERGKVISFVTPTPDLNLKPYVGRRIGVHGTRGFMPEYRRPHVTAGRVTPIENKIRR